MATYLWGVLCMRAIIDRVTNTASYIDCVEAFQVRSFPAQAPPIVAATLWRREAGERGAVEARARVESPEGETLYEEAVKLEMQPEHMRGRIHIQCTPFQLAGAGRYHVVVEQRIGDEWRDEARIPFEVLVRSLAAPNAPVTTAAPRRIVRKARARKDSGA
jgi:hypothetical protein